MKRFFSRNGAWRYIASLLLFAAAVVWLVCAITNTGSAVDSRSLENVKNTIEKGITVCYSIEGAYPTSIGYLEENYGITYDSEKYIVHYECFAANIRPTVTVIEK
jgi:hypothetical protein